MTVTAGVGYHYFTRGVNAGGESSDSNEVHATATVPSTFTGTSGADAFYLRRSGDNLHIWAGGPGGADGSGPPTYTVLYAAAPALTFDGGAGADVLAVDHANGQAIPTSGVHFTGGANVDTL